MEGTNIGDMCGQGTSTNEQRCVQQVPMCLRQTNEDGIMDSILESEGNEYFLPQTLADCLMLTGKSRLKFSASVFMYVNWE